MKIIGTIITGFYSFCILLFKKVCTFLLIFLTPLCFADTFSDAEEYFLANETDLAIQNFEMALTDGSFKPTGYSLLGASYLQKQDYKNALEIFLKGTDDPQTNKKSLYYNAGNASYLLQDYEQALEYYDFTLVADSSYRNAYLNRANTKVQLRDYENAINDYSTYISMNPQTEQAEPIYKMIGILENELELLRLEEERKVLEEARLAEQRERLLEEQRILEEQNRIAQEKAAEEAKRRQEILKQLSSSLEETETTNVSAGTEGAIGYEYEEAELE